MKIFLDTETTGLNFSEDEILELAILDKNKNVLFHNFLKPKHKKSWEEAEKIHGISYKNVENCKTIDFYKNEIIELINKSSCIVGYNTSYDMQMLENNLNYTFNQKIYDLMPKFAEIYGDFNEKYGSYKWQKLTTAAAYYNYEWEAKAHGAKADVLATIFLYKKLKENILDKELLLNPNLEYF